MNMNKLYCYNRWEFEKMCKENGWDDNNVPDDAAFISIIGTKDDQEYVVKEREYHYFQKKHSNVYNAIFDDISDFIVPISEEDNTCCVGINGQQALEIVRFIKENLGKDFYIHCRAGKSRSQAIVRYILDMYDGLYDFITRIENPPIYWNQFVLTELKGAAQFIGEVPRIDLLRNGIEATVTGFNTLGSTLKIEGLVEEVIVSVDRSWKISGKWYDEIEAMEVIQKLVESTKP